VTLVFLSFRLHPGLFLCIILVSSFFGCLWGVSRNTIRGLQETHWEWRFVRGLCSYRVKNRFFCLVLFQFTRVGLDRAGLGINKFKCFYINFRLRGFLKNIFVFVTWIWTSECVCVESGIRNTVLRSTGTAHLFRDINDRYNGTR
jgi:hypothetical protein